MTIELHTDGNAFSDPAGNETTGYNGWTPWAGVQVYTSSTIVYTGSYSAEIASLKGSFRTFYKNIASDWGLEVGQTYHLSVALRCSTSQPSEMWFGFSDDHVTMREAVAIVPRDDQWAVYEYDFKYDGILDYLIFENYTGDSYTLFYIDNLSFSETESFINTYVLSNTPKMILYSNTVGVRVEPITVRDIFLSTTIKRMVTSNTTKRVLSSATKRLKILPKNNGYKIEAK